MAVYKTYDQVGIKENLADIIYNISPTDTPFMSNVSKGTGLPTDGSARVFTEALLTDVVEDIWEQGGDPSIIMCGAFQKSKITGFTGNATKYKDVTDKTIVNAVDVYVSDYGELTVVPNRLMETDKVYVLQPDMFSVDYYRDFQTTDLAKTGDSDSKQMLVEYTLCSKNEKASGAILDLTTSV